MLTCPSCGATGHDDEPLPPGQGGPSHKTPSAGYAFERRGNWSRRPVRKCLTCGQGFTVPRFIGRTKTLDEREWKEHSEWWEKREVAERTAFDPLDEVREMLRRSKGEE